MHHTFNDFGSGGISVRLQSSWQPSFLRKNTGGPLPLKGKAQTKGRSESTRQCCKANGPLTESILKKWEVEEKEEEEQKGCHYFLK